MPDSGVPGVDGYIQVAVDSTGKKVDNAEITRNDGTVVERERVVLVDDDSVSPTMSIAGEADRGAASTHDRELLDALHGLAEIATEIRDLLMEFVRH